MTKIRTHLLTLELKEYAKSIGFQDIGIVKAVTLDDEAKRLESWLHQNLHGEMSYMNDHFDLRINPQKLHPGTKSIISFSYNYFNENFKNVDNSPKIAKYALGRDYHKVVKNKLKLIIKWLELKIGKINARAFVDSAPVMEREWAKRSGVGWVGKNSLLLTKGMGSFFFLGEIFLDVELEYDSSVKNYCGTCTKCIDACPTQAIIAPYVVDSNRCISYLTIEYKKEKLPENLSNNMKNWIYGCDICQDVCPINARAKNHSESDFDPKIPLLNQISTNFEGLTEEVFNTVFHDSAVKRTKYSGFMRNLSTFKL